jgi:hypothetical protein
VLLLALNHAVHAPGHVQHITHVIVDRLPADSIATATLKVATWTLGAAVITFIAVGVQIGIATRQLNLAEKELVAVKEDLNTALEMKRLAERAPILDLSIQVTLNYTRVNNYQQLAQLVQFGLLVKNSGNRVAKNVLIQIYIPSEAILNPASSPHRSQRPVGEKIYSVYEFGKSELRIPIDDFFRDELPLYLKPDLPSIELLWRIYDDDFAYPTEGLRTARIALLPLEQEKGPA